MVREKAAEGPVARAYMALIIVWAVAATILDLIAVYVGFGGLGLLLAFTVTPIAFMLAPFYAAVALDWWWPLIVEYGGMLVLFPLGWLLDRSEAGSG